MVRINLEKFRETMYQWHAGQSSTLYAAASSGLVADRAQLAAELRKCAQLAVHADTTPFKTPDCVAAKREEGFLKRAAAYVEAMPDKSFIHPADRRQYWPLPWAKIPAGACPVRPRVDPAELPRYPNGRYLQRRAGQGGNTYYLDVWGLGGFAKVHIGHPDKPREVHPKLQALAAMVERAPELRDLLEMARDHARATGGNAAWIGEASALLDSLEEGAF